MKKTALVLLVSLAGLGSSASADPQPDPYRWCVVRNLGDGVESCYFLTLAQCRASLAGGNEFCRRNYYYSGPHDDPEPTESALPRR